MSHSNNKQLIYLFSKFIAVAFEKRDTSLKIMCFLPPSLLQLFIIAYIIVWTIGPPGLYLSLKIIIIIIYGGPEVHKRVFRNPVLSF